MTVTLLYDICYCVIGSVVESILTLVNLTVTWLGYLEWHTWSNLLELNTVNVTEELLSKWELLFCDKSNSKSNLNTIQAELKPKLDLPQWSVTVICVVSVFVLFKYWPDHNTKSNFYLNI